MEGREYERVDVACMAKSYWTRTISQMQLIESEFGLIKLAISKN